MGTQEIKSVDVCEAQPGPEITKLRRQLSERLMESARINRIVRLAPWIVSAWLFAMSVCYGLTALQAARRQFNPGADQVLAAVWVALSAAIFLSHAIFRRRIVTLVWLELIATCAGVMIVFSEQLTSTLITLWLLALAWIWGDWLLRRAGAKHSEVTLAWVCLSLSIGLVLLSIVGLTLLIAQRMSSLWTWMVLLLLTVIQARSFLRWFEHLRLKAMGWSISKEISGPFERGPIIVLLGCIGLFNLAWALAPEIMYDSLSYHLAVPKAYLAHGGLVELHYGYNAHLVESIYTLAMALQGQIVAKLLTFAMGVITALGVYALGVKMFNERVGLWAAALLYSTALVSWLSSSTYIDLIVGMFLLSTLLAFLQWRATRQLIWLWVTAFLAGGAVGAKMNALFGLLVIAIVLVFDILRTPHLSGWSKLRSLAGCTLVASIVAAPYFIINYVFTGNPFFPLLHGIFTRGSLTLAHNINSDAGRFSLGYWPVAPLRLLFRFTFEAHQGLPRGVVGIGLALLPLTLFLFFWRRSGATLLLAIVAVYLVLLAYTVPITRYYISILPIVVVLVVAVVVHFSNVRWLRFVNLVCLGVTVVAQAGVIPLQFWQIPERVPVKVALGLETQDSFLTRALPAYPAVQYLNGVVQPNEKVVSFGPQYMRLYFKTPATWGLEFNGLRGPASEIARTLVSNGYAYLLLERYGSFRDMGSPLLRKEFLDHFAAIQFTENNVDVYRLSSIPINYEARKNLLPNPGFEALIRPGEMAKWSVFGSPRIEDNPYKAHNGRVSVQVVENGGLYIQVPVEPGEIYLLGAWSRADERNPQARLQIHWLGPDRELLNISQDIYQAKPDWTWNEFFAKAPARAVYAEVYANTHADGKVWLDDYMFCRMRRRGE